MEFVKSKAMFYSLHLIKSCEKKCVNYKPYPQQSCKVSKVSDDALMIANT